MYTRTRNSKMLAGLILLVGTMIPSLTCQVFAKEFGDRHDPTAGVESSMDLQYCNFKVQYRCQKDCEDAFGVIKGVSIGSDKTVSGGLIMYHCGGAPSKAGKPDKKCCTVDTMCGIQISYVLAGCLPYCDISVSGVSGTRCYKTVYASQPCPQATEPRDWQDYKDLQRTFEDNVTFPGGYDF